MAALLWLQPHRITQLEGLRQGLRAEQADQGKANGGPRNQALRLGGFMTGRSIPTAFNPDPTARAMDPMAGRPMCADAWTSLPMSRHPDPATIVEGPKSSYPHMRRSGRHADDHLVPRGRRFGTDYYLAGGCWSHSFPHNDMPCITARCEKSTHTDQQQKPNYFPFHARKLARSYPKGGLGELPRQNSDYSPEEIIRLLYRGDLGFEEFLRFALSFGERQLVGIEFLQ